MKKVTKKRKASRSTNGSNLAASVDFADSYDPCQIPPDLADELAAIQATNKLLPSTDAEQLSLSNIPPKAYTRQKEEVLDDFLQCLSIAPKNQWNNLLRSTVMLLPNGETSQVPYIIVLCSGYKTAMKLAIACMALIHWNTVTKKKRLSKNDKIPWYQPVTQSQRIRAFFGLMNKKYLWQMTLEDFEGEKMLGPFLENLYAVRYNKYKSMGYGQPKNQRRLTLNNRGKISLAIFDESDPQQHLMKVLFGCGAMFGFRGSAEHTYLELSHIRKGTFPPGHPWEGKVYYGFGGFQYKTNKLSLRHSFVPDDDEHMRVPYIENDPDSLGGAIHRLIPKFTRGQIRFYCKVMTKKQKEKYVRDGGDKNHCFQPNVHLGKTKIAELFKKGATLCGLDDPEDFYPHSLRAMFITSLANNPNLSIKEIMQSARHKSVTSTASYMVADGEQESHKFAALGMEMKRPRVDDGAAKGKFIFCWLIEIKIIHSQNVSVFFTLIQVMNLRTIF